MPNKSQKQDDKNSIEKRWERFSNWIHCICVITFDLELGQALEGIYPRSAHLSKQEITNICYLAFPDSNSGCMGDTSFVIRMPRNPYQSDLKRDLNREHLAYNSNCPQTFQINPKYYWGYVYFRQVKDVSLPRGYFQKSIVILSKLPFNNLFDKVVSLIAPRYFENGEPILETALSNIESWPDPVPGSTVPLPILGTVIQTSIPPHKYAVNKSFNCKDDTNNFDHHIFMAAEDLNLFEALKPVISHVHLLWELVLTAEPLVVLASSPINCSKMVLALVRMIQPLKYCADYRPYFTIHDGEFKQFASKTQNPPPFILGVTNPFFAKSLHHWPHTIKLGEDNSESHKQKLKKSSNPKMLDNTPGLYTDYKPFLQKDKSVIKKLLLGISSKRPDEVQSALLKRHLLELTQSFMIPLERYIASLMPLKKDISPFKATPIPLPFNPEDFFARLETTGPQLTSKIKGDWIGLYKKFFRSPNFNGWFNTKYTELALKLQASQLQALSDADLKLWVKDKPEVELVDMVLRIKAKLEKCKEYNIPVTDTVTESLQERMQDIISVLPEDLRNILNLS